MFNVLFVCKGNSARSIMAEAILNQFGGGKYRAYSAGAEPVGEVNPLVLKILKGAGLSSENLRSKSINEFTQSDAPVIDYVITLSDAVENLECGLCRGAALKAHWQIENPAESDELMVFRGVFRCLENRIRLLAELPVEKLDELKMHQELLKLKQKPE